MKPDHQNSGADASRQRKASTCSNSSSPDTRKFRLSCDNCFLAKVKCSKERPTCSRCGNLDHTCVYSPSRRAGKPKSSRNGPLGAPGSSKSPSLSLPRPQSPPAPCSPEAVQSWNFNPSETNVVPSSSAPERLTGMPLLSDLDNSSINFFGANSGPSSRHNHSYQDLESLFQPPSRPTMLDTCFDQNALNRSSVSMSDGVAPSFADDCLAMMGGSVPTFNSLSSSLSSDDASSLLSLEEVQYLSLPLSSKFNRFAAEVSGSSCNCSTALHDTLSTLYSPSTSFDHLLAINQNSINRVTLHLSCTCPPDISSIMLLSVIITKIIYWYRMSKDGKGLQNKALTLGTFKMDEEDEQRIRMGLVKSELRKVEVLLSRFRDRFERSLSGCDKQVYDANVAFLQRRLYDTIQGL